MTRNSMPSILLRLQTAESLSSQVSVLRELKNETIGHDQRKEAWVRWGIIPMLARVLGRRAPSTSNVASAAELNGAAGGTSRPRSEEDDACLQAIIVLGSLAQGGPAFLPPILSSDALPALLAILSSPGCPSYFCLPILRTLNTIADRLPLQSPQDRPKDTRLAELLFQKGHAECLVRILRQDYTTIKAQASIELAASLVGKLCTEESHKALLADCGVLDALSSKVAAFVVAQGFVLPGAEQYLGSPGTFEAIPNPAPSTAKLAPILRAVTVIIEHSKWRAEHFLSSPGIMTVFPKQIPDFSPTDVKKGPWGSTYLSGSAVPRHVGASPVEDLLPSVPMPQSKSSQSAINFPPLGYQASHQRHNQSFPTPFSMFDAASMEEDENAIVPWLLYVLRAEGGMVRLMAARLVTVLFRLGLAKKHRVSMFGFLLVPILIRMLDKEPEVQGLEGSTEYEGFLPVVQCLREEAPAVLALLVMDDQELQRHAVDGGAIKKLSQLLKESYNPMQDSTQPMWHADGEEDNGDAPGQGAAAGEQSSPECTLGPSGWSPMLCHVMKHRENILKALAALVPFKDEYRKAICENGVVPYIIDSLKPCSDEVPTETPNAKNTVADGNPTPTLLAACGAVRMLTRSVSILRTSLIDAGVAPPLFVLIRHPDIEVKIAATSVICNLSMDFSPVKDEILSADIPRILCENVHSPNTKLRIESLWALKHVAYRSTNDINMKIIDAVGPDWIRKVITQDPTRALTRRGLDTEMEGATPVGMGRINSAGEHVDLLNPVEDSADQDEDSKMADPGQTSKVTMVSFLPDATRRRKLALNGDLDQTTQARQDDIAVQEQTFDLIRNLICSTDSAEVIDYLFKQVGQDVILDSLADRLRPRSIPLPHRRESSSNNRMLHAPTEILVVVTFVLIHFAASISRHRELVMSHCDLLHNMMGYLNHHSRDVRANCVWVIINLTYPDDQADRDASRERAAKLRTLGILDQLSGLLNDSDLDVRERTRTAEHLVKSMDIRSGSGQ